KRIYQTIRWLNGALVLDPVKQQVVDRISLGEPTFASEGKDAHGIAVTPDGKQLWLSTQTTNNVTIFDTNDHQVIGRVSVGRDPNWIEFTPDGKFAFVSNTGSNDVTLIDVDRQKVVATVAVGASPKRLAVGSVVTKVAE
ncbi:MAG TPA: beta-propeller fold lactonase family protein, partial [Isosphaeraceae bacterium]|nr:beta-propeller fold lactonase family protein [Isosphaeraceae bacterium]